MTLPPTGFEKTPCDAHSFPVDSEVMSAVTVETIRLTRIHSINKMTDLLCKAPPMESGPHEHVQAPR